ncbi:MAG: SCO family protein [Candidatus Kariarchaeaceae archaeon]|jgi:cytochrome oxidase Cu insertion factor (SCO1/SenC/PrrC family)
MSSDLSQIQKNRLIGIIGFVTVVTIIVVASFSGNLISDDNNDEGITSLPNFGLAADFTLPSIDGTNYTFSADAGKVRLVTFFYTKCQAGCSVITSRLAGVQDQIIKQDLTDSVQITSVDFDHIHDNMTDLMHYAHIFTNSTDYWQFLLGNENQTLDVVHDWNFNFTLEPMITSTTETSTATTTNTTDHSIHEGHEVVYIHPFIVYFIDQQGDIRRLFLGLDWTIDDVFEVIDFLLNEAIET